jgi:hypothetical protein
MMSTCLPLKFSAALWELGDFPLLHPDIKQGRMFFVKVLVLCNKVSPPVWFLASSVIALGTEG